MSGGFDLTGVLNSIITVVAFVAFLGIFKWAYSARRRREFDEAANAPFALPDDVVTPPMSLGDRP